MLILTRKVNEGIMIGDHIEVRICRVNSDTVRVGIEAPREMAIYRNESYKQIKETNLAALRKVSSPADAPKLPRIPAALKPAV